MARKIFFLPRRNFLRKTGLLTTPVNRIATTGKQIWECGGQVSNPIPSPILVGDHVICMTGYQGNAILSIALDSEGDVTNTKQVAWSNDEAAPYVPSAILYQGQLYLNKGNNNLISKPLANNLAGSKNECCALTEGVAQAENYADKLSIRFAYSTNGQSIYEVDMETDVELKTVAKTGLEPATHGL